MGRKHFDNDDSAVCGCDGSAGVLEGDRGVMGDCRDEYRLYSFNFFR